MTKKIVVLLIFIFLFFSTFSLTFAKSKIWDILMQEQKQEESQPQPHYSRSVIVKLVTGEQFVLESTDTNYDDIIFEGVMKVEQPDGIYYINSSQVAYIKAAK